MLAIISPAKTLDFENAIPKKLPVFQPHFLVQSRQLIDICRELTPTEIASLMSISDKLAGLNAARFTDWKQDHNEHNAKAAIYAFKGDVYTGLDIESLTEEDVLFAQQHLRILSGLYGLLTPLDLIQPYRLEMGTKLGNPKGKDLYAFWHNIITPFLQQEIDQQGGTLINLASDEYYKSIQEKNLDAKIIKPIFLDNKSGKYKVISFYAKKARGLMCRYLIQHRISEVEQLKEFDFGGYWFDSASSSQTEFVFKRNLAE